MADAAEITVPPRHDGARQALAYLGRMLDAERHRIRRELIRVARKSDGDETCGGDPHGVRKEWGQRDVAETLASAAVAISVWLLLGSAVAMRCFRRDVPHAAITDDIYAECCQQHCGEDRHYEAGAEKTHEAGR